MGQKLPRIRILFGKTVDFACLLLLWDYRVNIPVYPYYFLNVFLLLSRIFILGDNKRWRQSIYFGLIDACVFCFASFGRDWQPQIQPFIVPYIEDHVNVHKTVDFACLLSLWDYSNSAIIKGGANLWATSIGTIVATIVVRFVL